MNPSSLDTKKRLPVEKIDNSSYRHSDLNLGNSNYESINLHWWIDKPCEPETCIETNGARQHEETIGGDKHVAKVKSTRN